MITIGIIQLISLSVSCFVLGFNIALLLFQRWTRGNEPRYKKIKTVSYFLCDRCRKKDTCERYKIRGEYYKNYLKENSNNQMGCRYFVKKRGWNK